MDYVRYQVSLPVDTRECGHCGGVAVESDKDGLFGEDMAGPCLTCGFPGHIVVTEAYEDDDSPGHAAWSEDYDENARCNEAACVICPRVSP